MTQKKAPKERRQGLTLIELMVVFAIVMVLIVYTIAGYSGAFPRLAMERNIETLKSDIYRARERAYSSLAHDYEGEIKNSSYGILIENTDEGADSYTFFRTKESNKEYGEGAVNERVVDLEEGIHIESEEYEDLHILFCSEEKKVYFNGEKAEGDLEVTLSYEGEEFDDRILIIDEQGTVELEF